MRVGSAASGLSWTKIWELACRRWRNLHRSWLPYAVAAFVLASAAVMYGVISSTSQAAFAVFFLGGLSALAIGGGAIARDFESGVMLLDRVHGSGPAEIILGTAIYTATVVFAAGGLAAALIFSVAPQYFGGAALSFITVVAFGLVAWVALLVLLGSLVPGSGNSAIALALVVIVGPLSEFSQGGSPNIMRASAKFIAGVFPPEIVSAFLRLPRPESVWRPIATLTFCAVAFLCLAVVILVRREPAKGWRR